MPLATSHCPMHWPLVIYKYGGRIASLFPLPSFLSFPLPFPPLPSFSIWLCSGSCYLPGVCYTHAILVAICSAGVRDGLRRQSVCEDRPLRIVTKPHVSTWETTQWRLSASVPSGTLWVLFFPSLLSFDDVTVVGGWPSGGVLSWNMKGVVNWVEGEQQRGPCTLLHSRIPLVMLFSLFYV